MTADDRNHSDAVEVAARPAKARKRKPVRPAVDDASKRSLNLRIDQRSYRILNVHALMEETTISELVMGFAETLKTYTMPHRRGDSGGQDQ